jgi:hypothetical protein
MDTVEQPYKLVLDRQTGGAVGQVPTNSKRPFQDSNPMLFIPVDQATADALRETLLQLRPSSAENRELATES